MVRSQLHKLRVQGVTSNGFTGSAPSAPETPIVLTQNLPVTIPSVVGFGDSVMVGSFASIPALQNINLFATGKSAGTPLNKGVGGTWITNLPSVATAPAATVDNGRDRFQADLMKANKRDSLVINYGFNDSRYTQLPHATMLAAFIEDYREVLNGLIIDGYKPEKIMLGNMYCLSDARLANTDPDQTRAQYEAFVNGIEALAKEYGTFFAPTYQRMNANGGPAALIGGDDLHPNDAGHGVIADAYLAAVRTYTGTPTNIRMVGNADGSLDISWDAVTAALSYEVEATLKTALAFTSSTTSSTTSKKISALAAGDYVCRVRPVFAAGAKGSWGFNNIPVEVGGVLFALDNFYDVDGTLITAHVGDGGLTWIRQPVLAAPSSDIDIQGGRLRATSANASVYQASTAPPSANYSVTTWVEIETIALNAQAGPAGRMQAAANTLYYARYTEGASPVFSLHKVVAGTTTQLGANVNTTGLLPRLGERAKLTLSMVGTTIKMLVDDVEVVSVTDASIAVAGKAGVRMAGVNTGPDTNAQIQSFYAKGL